MTAQANGLGDQGNNNKSPKRATLDASGNEGNGRPFGASQ